MAQFLGITVVRTSHYKNLINKMQTLVNANENLRVDAISERIKNENLEQKNELLERNNTELMSEIIELKDKLAEAEVELKAKTDAIEEARRDMEGMQSRLALAEQLLTELREREGDASAGVAEETEKKPVRRSRKKKEE